MKTILILTVGFLFFGKEGLNLQVVLGMIVAVISMIWYGHVSSLPGGKERRQSLSNYGPEKDDRLIKSNKLDDEV